MRTLRVLFTLFWVGLLLAGIHSCGASSSPTSDAASGKVRKIRVRLGEVKEIDFPNPKDTTLLLIGSSENHEIVDVTRRQLKEEDNTYAAAETKEPAVFLIKGVTNGTAKVIFSEKRPDEEGPGRILRTYQVEVITRK